jgi:ribonuclease HI
VWAFFGYKSATIIPMHYTIFTDGSSRGNPGPGGWGAVIIEDREMVKGGSVKSAIRVIELGGRENSTTNNRMELTAAAKALFWVIGNERGFSLNKSHKNATKVSTIDIYTDSSYLINGITKWVRGWKYNGWKTKTKDDVLNKDLWLEIDDAVSGNESMAKEIIKETGVACEVFWHHVGGHVGIAGNERCDVIATTFADNNPVKLYDGALSEYSVPNILDFSHDETKKTAKDSSSYRSKAKAYSYVSKVGGVIKTHPTWAECESRVKGVAGARFKKALDAQEERKIMAEFG